MWDVGCSKYQSSECVVFRRWDVQDLKYSGRSMLKIRDVLDVGWFGRGMFRIGMFGIWDVWDVGCLGFGMLEMWNDQPVACLRCRMPRIWDVWDVGWLLGQGMLIYKMSANIFYFFLRIYIRILKILKILFITKSITRSFLLGFTKNDVNLAKYYLIFRLFIPKVILKSPCYTFYYKVISPTCIYNLLIISVEVGVLL